MKRAIVYLSIFYLLLIKDTIYLSFLFRTSYRERKFIGSDLILLFHHRFL